MDKTGSGENRRKIIDRIEYGKILDCIHCGLCLNVCPTYLELGLEQDSARGRIYLMRMYAEDKIEVSES
ncbi:4Fe-4S dicluster domain-containing protein, partial [bacterium]|nr:4Fe-4S dicluster domain-containing protein [bacterium]